MSESDFHDDDDDLPDLAPEHERDDQTANMFGDAEPPEAEDKASPYVVLARKYRPQRFEDLVGQEAMVHTLANAFRKGRIAHAFMLTGVRGIGKTTTARLLARALNYETDTSDEPSVDLNPLGRHCQAIIESRHPDVLELDAASRTGVDDMRELLDGARYTPVSARYKVFIIDEVHMLSKSAFNALLKTLEEPPAHVKFVFATTEIRKVPVTVLSRCQRFDLRRLDIDQLSAHLANICAQEEARVSPEGLTLIARAAEGSVRDALSILDQAIVTADDGMEVPAETIRDMLGLADRSRLLTLFDFAASGDQKGALTEAEDQLTGSADPMIIFKDLIDLAVEVSRARVLGDDYTAAGPAEWSRMTKAIAEKLSPAQATRLWQILMRGFEAAGFAPEPATALKMTLIQLAAAASVPPPEDAIKAIVEAKTGASPNSGGPAPSPSGSGVTALGQPSTFDGILALLGHRKRADIHYEVERFVRPGDVRFGSFSCELTPNAPPALVSNLQQFLTRETGTNWKIEHEPSNAETVLERREREKAERIDAALKDEALAELLRHLPGAEVLDVTVPQTEPGEGENVVHLDFNSDQKTRKEHR